MEELFRSGTDMHIRTAQFIFGRDDVTDEERQIAKIANFSLLYGAGAETYAAILFKLTRIRLNISQAIVVKQKWLQFYSGINAWQTLNLKRYKQKGWWTTALGRPYKAKILTDFNNIQNSGSGAEVTKLSLKYLWEKIGSDSNIKLLNVVHDSFTLECKWGEHEKYCDMLGESMVEGWKEMSKLFMIKDLPMPVTVCVGKTWGKAIEKNPLYKKEYK